MGEDAWHAARLIPTSGINGAEEQERRATSALLAVMSAVREFGRVMTQPLGAPVGAVETFIEVPFELGDRKVFPDGLIRVSRGKRAWVCLVEVKTGTNELAREQIENYLDVARDEGFDVVLTISNQLSPTPGEHPVQVDRRKVRKVALHHMSWTEVLSNAVLQKVHRGIADPDQAWILGELIRYLEHPRSGALEFDDMGESWVSVRDAVANGTFRPSDRGAAQCASRWDQLVRYACLRLGRELGVEVQQVLSRKELADPSLRAQSVLRELAEHSRLTGEIRIPDTVGHLTVTADLRAQRVSASIDVAAPQEGRQLTRVNWLVRQLKDAPDSTRIDAFVANARSATASELLGTVRTNPGCLVADPKRDLRSFRVVLSAPMGSKRGQGRGSFISSVLGVLDDFYGTTVQNLRAWTPAAPKLRDTDEPARDAESAGVPAALVSTAPSSQDGPLVDSASPAPAVLHRSEQPEYYGGSPTWDAPAAGDVVDGNALPHLEPLRDPGPQVVERDQA